MHAYLVIGGTSDQGLRFIDMLLASSGVGEGVNARYILTPTNQSITIDAVRQAQVWVGQATLGRRACLIHQAHRLTQAAQHALLKTIEEPESDTIIVLSAPSEYGLLSTIRSRCVTRRLPTSPERSLKDPTRAPGIEQFTRANAQREDTQRVFDQLIHHTHQSLCASSTGETRSPRVLRAALRAHARLQVQCNPALVVGQFILDIPT